MPRIKVIEENEAQGRLKEIYKQIKNKRGKLANVHKIQSLRPESIIAHMDLYMELMYSRSELNRSQREMIGVVVSAANGCNYCVKHHSQALNNYWKDEDRLQKLINNNIKTILSKKEKTIYDFARKLTLKPSSFEENDYTKKLKEAGLSDSGVLDVTLITAYFNFVNRIVLSLETELETDKGAGYKY